MRIYAIDPGPETCGMVRYDTDDRAGLDYDKARPVDDVLLRITDAARRRQVDLIACERVQSYGISGGHLLLTCEVYGRIWDRSVFHGLPFHGLRRREVLAALDLLGASGNRDAAVRARLIEMHGSTKRAACGTKAAPGPLYGVSSHAWQALGVAVAIASQVSPRPTCANLPPWRSVRAEHDPAVAD